MRTSARVFSARVENSSVQSIVDAVPVNEGISTARQNMKNLRDCTRVNSYGVARLELDPLHALRLWPVSKSRNKVTTLNNERNLKPSSTCSNYICWKGLRFQGCSCPACLACQAGSLPKMGRNGGPEFDSVDGSQIRAGRRSRPPRYQTSLLVLVVGFTVPGF